ncbi:MAG TPA: response regulator transcription factor [Fimbriimonadaceae bacterium]|nr:response regulator transcription factor [Fimbriimonadaceae bacterium]
MLLVEDEEQMAAPVASALRDDGYAVTVASNGRTGLKEAPNHDVLIVDVMMPAMNGFEMVRELRARGHFMPVIFLTAKDGVDHRVEGLTIGDDYLVKPFFLAELLARVKLLVRQAQRASEIVEYGDLQLDLRSRKAIRGGESIYLSNTEFSLLELLFRTPETPVSKRAILREVWGSETNYSPNVVEVYVGYLRAKLEAGGGPRLLHTLKGVGYVLSNRAENA